LNEIHRCAPLIRFDLALGFSIKSIYNKLFHDQLWSITGHSRQVHKIGTLEAIDRGGSYVVNELRSAEPGTIRHPICFDCSFSELRRVRARIFTRAPRERVAIKGTDLAF